MASTKMCIVLVGTSLSTATGVTKEITMAMGLDVPVFGVYVDGADISSTLPLGLRGNRTVAWGWPTIAPAVEHMMGDGKNAK
jgi:hypothetical protein